MPDVNVDNVDNDGWVRYCGNDAKDLPCNGASSCVEVKILDDGKVLLRDSKQAPYGPVLCFTAQEWESFVLGVCANEFDIKALEDKAREYQAFLDSFGDDLSVVPNK